MKPLFILGIIFFTGLFSCIRFKSKKHKAWEPPVLMLILSVILGLLLDPRPLALTNFVESLVYAFQCAVLPLLVLVFAIVRCEDIHKSRLISYPLVLLVITIGITLSYFTIMNTPQPLGAGAIGLELIEIKTTELTELIKALVPVLAIIASPLIMLIIARGQRKDAAKARKKEWLESIINAIVKYLDAREAISKKTRNKSWDLSIEAENKILKNCLHILNLKFDRNDEQFKVMIGSMTNDMTRIYQLAGLLKSSPNSTKEIEDFKLQLTISLGELHESTNSLIQKHQKTYFAVD